MSPGMATTSVPPALGVPVAADAGADGASEVPGAVDGAVDGAAADGAVLVVAPPHAAKTIVVAAKSAPMRTRIIDPPPLCGPSPPGLPMRGPLVADPNAGQDTVGLPRSYFPSDRPGAPSERALEVGRRVGLIRTLCRETVRGGGRLGGPAFVEEGGRRQLLGRVRLTGGRKGRQRRGRRPPPDQRRSPDVGHPDIRLERLVRVMAGGQVTGGLGHDAELR